MNDTDLLPPRAAGDILGVSHLTLKDWRADGKGPSFIVLPTGRIRYRRADLEAWAENRATPPVHDAPEATPTPATKESSDDHQPSTRPGY